MFVHISVHVEPFIRTLTMSRLTKDQVNYPPEEVSILITNHSAVPGTLQVWWILKYFLFLSTGFSKQMWHESDEQVQIKVNAELYLTFYATNLLLQINSSTYLNSLCFYGF